MSDDRNLFAPAEKRTGACDSHGGRNIGETPRLYSWKATGRVSYELHAEPDGAPRGYAQSYEKGQARDLASGTLTAAFPGIHGCYWENPGENEVRVTLRTAGFYNMSHEFRKDVPVKTKMFK